MSAYLTKQEQIHVLGVADLAIRSLLDREQFDDPLGEAARQGISSATWPLFGLLWPSGALLAARMAARLVLPGERVLEVGCGLALASLVGHRRGADMTASDCHPLTETFLLENLRLNQLPPMKYRHGPWELARAPGSVLAGPPRPEAGLDTVAGQFDLIIGSDLLYDRSASVALAGFIGRHAAARAEVWIVDPDRGNRPAFNRLMQALGFDRHEERLDRLASLGQGAYKGRMLTYLRSR